MPFVLDRDRIRLADVVLVYLERVVATSDPVAPETLPRAHGVAPLAVGPDQVVLAPVPPDEAIWLGFQAVDPGRPAVLRVRVDGSDPVDAVTGESWDDDVTNRRSHVVCPPEFGLAGRPVTGGRRLFGSGGLERLTLLLLEPVRVEVTVQLVLPGTFFRVTRRVPPRLDPGSAYTGRRLP